MESEIDRLKSRIVELEQRLRDSEENYRQVTDTINEVFWMTDPVKSQMLFISAAYERIWGRTRQSLLENPTSFVDFIHPNDRDRVLAAFPRQADGTYDIEYRIVRDSGEIRWIHDKAFALRDSTNAVYRVLGVAHDITDQREDKERFRQVTDTIDEVFWITDPLKNKMLFISPAYERIWGRTCESLLADPMSFIEAMHPDDRDRVIAAFPQQANGTYDVEYRILHTDGSLRWIRDRAFPLSDHTGEIYRIVGVAQDITENKSLMRALEIEKERSENLLENILPKSIIEALKGKENPEAKQQRSPVVAHRIDAASVLFADLVGFTSFAGTQEAAFVVEQLNHIVRAFDDIAHKLGVEKIKTIGDCYMLAGGVPNQQDDHAERVARAALEMRYELERINEQRDQNFKIRIGIHSGPLVAGVIGTKKYVYDLWGDTVNVASRMESSGLPGEIQISDQTRRLLGECFVCEDRGLIEVKGKGEVRTHLLRSMSPKP
jgi:PAS domain S-box-containing protein